MVKIPFTKTPPSAEEVVKAFRRNRPEHNQLCNNGTHLIGTGKYFNIHVETEKVKKFKTLHFKIPTSFLNFDWIAT